MPPCAERRPLSGSTIAGWGVRTLRAWLEHGIRLNPTLDRCATGIGDQQLE